MMKAISSIVVSTLFSLLLLSILMLVSVEPAQTQATPTVTDVLAGIGNRLARSPVSAGEQRPSLTSGSLEYTSSNSNLCNDFTPLSEYPLDSSPLNITTSNDGTLWFTLPFSNAIGSLVIAPNSRYTVTYHTLPVAESEPYDLLYDAGANTIWFSEFAGNKIGRLDIDAVDAISNTTAVTTTAFVHIESRHQLRQGVDVEEYEIPTAASGPRGIAQSADGLIWYVANEVNVLGNLNPSNGEFTEFAFTPRNVQGNAQLEDIAIRNSNSILFTAPGDHDVIDFRISSETFFHTFFGTERTPTNIVVTANDAVWVTDNATGQVSKYIDQTLATWLTYFVHPATSGPTNITTNAEGQLFVAGSSANLVATIIDRGTANQAFECTLPEQSVPRGLVADAQSTIWIADEGQKKILAWRAPFVRTTYFPFIAD